MCRSSLPHSKPGLLLSRMHPVNRLPSGGCPHPQHRELYSINRDTLFSYHTASESFLHRLMALYVASHYKVCGAVSHFCNAQEQCFSPLYLYTQNSPNDLQLLSDAPAHHLFCLLGPVVPTRNALPEVLCVVQVCLEGEISRSTVANSLARGKTASGDLIPWTIAQQVCACVRSGCCAQRFNS